MKSIYNWGILGPGNIAHKFAEGLRQNKNAKLLAIGSRNIQRAQNFGLKYKAEKFYGNYEDLINDSDIDIIYIATPHHLHYELSKKCLEAKKNLLCEKPACINALQFEELINIAKKNQVFYMEALWTRFLPGIKKSLKIIPELGKIHSINANFGFKAPFDPESRLFNPELGGGTTLDIGIYTLFIPLLFLGYPDQVKASAILGETGVDESSAIILKYSDGAIASLMSTFRAETSTTAEISSEKGRIVFTSRFFTPCDIHVYREGKKMEIIKAEYKQNGYEYEAKEVMDCLDIGLTESPLLPHNFTLNLLKLMDEIRNQFGLKYKWDIPSK